MKTLNCIMKAAVVMYHTKLFTERSCIFVPKEDFQKDSVKVCLCCLLVPCGAQLMDFARPIKVVG